MTVQELIDALNLLPKDAVVHHCGEMCAYATIGVTYFEKDNEVYLESDA